MDKTAQIVDLVAGALRGYVERALSPFMERLGAVEKRTLSEQEVRSLVGAVPPGEKGEKGDPGVAGQKGDPGAQGVPGVKGDPGESVHPDTVRVLVSEAIAEIPPAPAGKDADPAVLAAAVQAEVQRQFDAIRPLIKGERGDAGAGLDDMEMELKEDGRTLVFRFVGAGASKEFEVVAPWQIYRGVWKSGAYKQGDVVTYAGSSWTAVADAIAADVPGKSDKWQLSVKKGKDA